MTDAGIESARAAALLTGHCPPQSKREGRPSARWYADLPMAAQGDRSGGAA